MREEDDFKLKSILLLFRHRIFYEIERGLDKNFLTLGLS